MATGVAADYAVSGGQGGDPFVPEVAGAVSGLSSNPAQWQTVVRYEQPFLASRAVHTCCGRSHAG